MIAFVVFCITVVIVALHGIAVYAAWHLLPQRVGLKRDDMIAVGLIATSGLLHIINFIR